MKIPLTQNKFAIIDKEDFLLISKYKWHYRKSGKTKEKNGYAEHSIFDKEYYKKFHKTRNKNLFMHNLIIPHSVGMQVDHINRNGLDNRRKNLRVGTISQNYANFPKKKGTNSKYRGVSFLKRKNGRQWQASTTLNGKGVYIGIYETEKEAALAYNQFAKKVFKDFAQLNEV